MRDTEQDVPAPLAGAPSAETWRRLAAVLLGYLLVGVAYTWPLAARWTDAAIQLGEVPVDAGQNIWNLWWTLQRLGAGASPLSTRYLFYPQDIDLFWQTLGLSNGALMLPVTALLGPVAAFNAVILLSFGLGGLLTYLVCRRLGLEVGPSLVGGLVFVIAPSRQPPILGGALEIVAVHWIPLAVLLLMRALQLRRLSAGLLAGLTLLGATLSSHYYGLYGAVYVAAHAGLAALAARGRARLQIAAAAAAALGLWAAALLLIAGPALGGASLTPDWLTRQIFHSAALADLLPLNTRHPLWGGAALAVVEQLHPFGAELGLAPGLVAYALCAAAIWRRPRAALPWLALAAAMLLLAMGPRLKLGEQPTGLPMPYAALDMLGPFRNSTRPSRFVALMMLPVAVLAAHGAAALRAALPNHLRRAAPAAAATLLAAELAVQPWPLLPIHAAPAASALRADPVPGAVLELPPRTNDSRAMVNQLCHGRPLAGGYLARTPDYPPINGASAVRRLWLAEPEQPDIFAHDPAGELATIGVRFVAIDAEQISGSRARRLRALLDAPGVARVPGAQGLEVYAVDPAAARPAAVPAGGWYAPESDGERVWRWVEATAALRLLARTPSLVRLELDATAYARERPLALALDGAPLASIAVPAAPQRRPIALTLMLPAGEHRLTLTSESDRAPDGRQLSLSVGPVRISGVALAADAASDAGPPPALSPAAGGVCGESAAAPNPAGSP